MTEAVSSGSPRLLGNARLMKMAFDGRDLAPLGADLLNRVAADPGDADALMDLSAIAQLTGDRENGMVFQQLALELRQHFHMPAPSGRQAIRLLALMGTGDFMANTPLDFLLEGSDVALDMVYVGPGLPFPPALPEHDVLFVAVGESEENQPLLHQLAEFLKSMPGPVLNRPEGVAGLSRDGVCEALAGIPGLIMPPSVRIARSELADIAQGRRSAAQWLGDPGLPMIVRPVDSHAGRGLERIGEAGELNAYLNEYGQDDFFISPFVDYRGADGLFRKARVAVIDGRPFAAHMAVSDHWMIHYLNAGMAESAAKREEEAAFMAGFDQGFAARHAEALDAVTRKLGLDYYALDCAETADGRLLIFEADSSMVVHSMDPEDLFPYKKPQMRKVFAAFRDLLAKAAGEAQ